MDGLDARILAAATRCGRRLFTNAELLEEGATYEHIRGRTTRRQWQRVHPGVVLVGAGDLTWEERALAAVKAGGGSTVVSHRSAARMHGIGEYGDILEISVPHGTEVHAAGVMIHRTRRATPTVIVRGVACTSVEETLLGLAAVLPPRLVHEAFTTAWRKRRTTPKKVLRHLEEHAGRGVAGVVRLRDVVELYDGCRRGPGSEAEARLVWELFPSLDAGGIERPELQAVIAVRDGRERVTLDFLWPARRKVVEMMGLSAHGDYVQHDHDVERAELIRAAGYDLREVTPRAVRDRRDETIRALLEFLTR